MKRQGDTFTAAAAFTFTKVTGSAAFYYPDPRGKDNRMFFLRRDAAGAAKTIAARDIWADTGSPASPGWVVFLSRLPEETQMRDLEADLRKLLAGAPPAAPSPTTAFFWATLSQEKSKSTLAISTLLRTRLDPENHPVVDGDTRLSTPPGIPSLVFPDGARLFARRDEQGTLTGVTSAFSPSMSSFPASGLGITLPLGGDPDPQRVGCVMFQALVDAPRSPKSPGVSKSLVNVSLDPLNPIGRGRNFQTLTDWRFILAGTDGNYTLTPIAERRTHSA
jgi:hypothetical protein